MQIIFSNLFKSFQIFSTQLRDVVTLHCDYLSPKFQKLKLYLSPKFTQATIPIQPRASKPIISSRLLYDAQHRRSSLYGVPTETKHLCCFAWGERRP